MSPTRPNAILDYEQTLDAVLSEFGLVTIDPMTMQSKRVLAVRFDCARARHLSGTEKTAIKAELLAGLGERLDKLLFPIPKDNPPGI